MVGGERPFIWLADDVARRQNDAGRLNVGRNGPSVTQRPEVPRRRWQGRYSVDPSAGGLVHGREVAVTVHDLPYAVGFERFNHHTRRRQGRADHIRVTHVYRAKTANKPKRG
jgi:hypothetical protein